MSDNTCSGRCFRKENGAGCTVCRNLNNMEKPKEITMSATKDFIADLFTQKASFQEDFEHENGKYTCKCWTCKKPFIGHKGRTTCKHCFATFNAKAVLKKGDRVRVSKCPGTKRIISFSHWDGQWMVSKSGRNDYHAINVDMVNCELVDFTLEKNECVD
jgi:hypothetical protein